MIDGITKIFDFETKAFLRLFDMCFKFLSVIWIIALIINIILNFILIPILSIEGAAISTLISYLIVFQAAISDHLSHLFFSLQNYSLAYM